MFHTGQGGPVDLITDGVASYTLTFKKSTLFSLSVLFCPGLGEHCGPKIDVRVLIKKR